MNNEKWTFLFSHRCYRSERFSAAILNGKMSHKLRHKWRCELTRIIEEKAKL
ncbi:MAG: hypothetical protein LBK66_13855 [Spirochaetaceae bacterium]|nr:hypothetical protein [Spirochaetaceae bacterium]